ncbi:hypothetical protein PFUGPA_01376 [Plasmodium falciparum Palo Alto/Uganda]|uniref:Uncharacterized protein n=1 Tax=Plasmodium falciparum (isolate Palo Alto / Uganda) TaxID=57270 RepID=W4J4N4_PLAFP|nr:hypothetical protein PFUGPA_01376 [Plasmodium falciparum Palo Alto/Uganda]
MEICKNILFLNFKNLSIIKGKKRKEKITCQFPKYIGTDNNKRCIINLMLYKIFKGYILLLLWVIIILKLRHIRLFLNHILNCSKLKKKSFNLLNKN